MDPGRRPGGTHALRPPRVVRIARYPVTNAPYLRFVRAGGYDKDKYWHLGASARRRFLTRRSKVIVSRTVV
jgi:formylglycine-generating enzyme required for sulfatase activity